jgi:hypothetical protein
MDITFSLQNGQYIAEFKVTSEFNLHIEKGVGSIQMFQRTSGTFFDKVEDFKMEKNDIVCDFDSGSFIGEKTIRLVSSVEPRYCFITTDGEVTEIKSQSKEVEITSNGTMDIVPDAGFSYLNSVKVKTNVPKGEGGSGGGGGSNVIEYLYLSKGTGLLTDLNKSIPIEWKGKNMMTNKLMPVVLQSAGSYGSMTSLDVLKVIKGIVVKDGVEYDNTSYEKLLESNGIDSSYFTEITEEEYNNYTV